MVCIVYIDVQVITETLRMGNIIIGVMRKAMKDVEIKGYLIPKGWCVFAYFRSVHLDENNYDWPYKFNPWRWQVRRRAQAPCLFFVILSSFSSSFVVSFSFLVMANGRGALAGQRHDQQLQLHPFWRWTKAVSRP